MPKTKQDMLTNFDIQEYLNLVNKISQKLELPIEYDKNENLNNQNKESNSENKDLINKDKLDELNSKICKLEGFITIKQSKQLELQLSNHNSNNNKAQFDRSKQHYKARIAKIISSNSNEENFNKKIDKSTDLTIAEYLNDKLKYDGIKAAGGNTSFANFKTAFENANKSFKIRNHVSDQIPKKFAELAKQDMQELMKAFNDSTYNHEDKVVIKQLMIEKAQQAIEALDNPFDKTLVNKVDKYFKNDTSSAIDKSEIYNKIIDIFKRNTNKSVYWPKLVTSMFSTTSEKLFEQQVNTRDFTGKFV